MKVLNGSYLWAHISKLFLRLYISLFKLIRSQLVIKMITEKFNLCHGHGAAEVCLIVNTIDINPIPLNLYLLFPSSYTQSAALPSLADKII